MTPELIKFSGLYLAYVLAIHAIPGPWRGWTSHGATFDAWTLTHLAWGQIAKQYKLSLTTLLLLSILNEGAEAYLRHIKFLGIWGDPETPANVVVDLASTSLGWAL